MYNFLSQDKYLVIKD